MDRKSELSGNPLLAPRASGQAAPRGGHGSPGGAPAPQKRSRGCAEASSPWPSAQVRARTGCAAGLYSVSRRRAGLHHSYLAEGRSRALPFPRVTATWHLLFFLNPSVLSSHFVPCRPLSSGLSFALSAALPPGGHLLFSLLHPHSNTAPSTTLSLASDMHGASLAR